MGTRPEHQGQAPAEPAIAASRCAAFPSPPESSLPLPLPGEGFVYSITEGDAMNPDPTREPSRPGKWRFRGPNLIISNVVEEGSPGKLTVRRVTLSR